MLNFKIPPVNRNDEMVSAKSPAAQNPPEYEKLSDEINHLKMVLESVWNLLKEKTKMSDEELKEELKAIKFKHAETAARSKPGTCTNCGRVIAKESVKCVFCGTVQKKERRLF